MNAAETIRAELKRFMAAEAVVNAALMVYAAIKVTQSQQPQMVMGTLPALETALEGWCTLAEASATPESEATKC